MVGDQPEVYAQVSDTDAQLVATVEAIRAQIVERSHAAQAGLASLPNGHFMEIEFLAEGASVHGVVFLTPFLPDKFVLLLREILAEVGIEHVL